MLDYLILLARQTEAVDTGKGMSAEWAIVLAGLVIGLLATLMPPKRTSEIKKHKEE